MENPYSARVLLRMLALPLLAGLMLRLPWLRLARLPDTDGCMYVALAREMGEGRFGLSAFFLERVAVITARPPLYPSAMALVYRLLGDAFAAGVVVSLIMGLLTVVALTLLARSWSDERTARAVAWLAAIHPLLVLYSGQILRESMAAFFFAALLLAMTWAVRTGSRKSGLGVGVLLGISAMNRLDALIFCGPALLLFGLGIAESGSRRRLLARRVFPLLLLGLVLVMGLYSLTMRAATESTWLPLSDMVTWEATKNCAEEGSTAIETMAAVARWWPGTYLQYYETLIPRMLPPLLLALVVAGIIFPGFPSRIGLAAIGSLALGVALYALYPRAEIRFIVPLVAFALPVAGAGVVAVSQYLLQRVPESRRDILGERSIKAVILLVLALSFVKPLTEPVRTRMIPQQVPVGELETGRFLAAHVPKGSRMMSRHPLPAVIGNMKWAVIPESDINEIASKAESLSVEYLILDRPSIEKKCPGLLPLFESRNTPDDFEIIWTWQPGSRYEILVVKTPFSP
ncbi:glycosyltransferase family 39 protein [Acidobacteriota bacterium]